MAEWRSRAWAKSGRPKGATDGFTAHTRKKMIAKANKLAKEFLMELEKEGFTLPPDGTLAREAIETVATLMRREDLPKDKLAAASKILEYTLAKPAQTINANVKRAEDFLDEIAGDM